MARGWRGSHFHGRSVAVYKNSSLPTYFKYALGLRPGGPYAFPLSRSWGSQGSPPELHFPFSRLPSASTAWPPPCPVSLCGWRRLLALFPGAGCINSGLRKSRVEFWKTPYFFSPPEDFSSVTQTPSCGGPLRGRSGCLHVLVRTVCLEARVRSV